MAEYVYDVFSGLWKPGSVYAKYGDYWLPGSMVYVRDQDVWKDTYEGPRDYILDDFSLAPFSNGWSLVAGSTSAVSRTTSTPLEPAPLGVTGYGLSLVMAPTDTVIRKAFAAASLLGNRDIGYLLRTPAETAPSGRVLFADGRSFPMVRDTSFSHPYYQRYAADLSTVDMTNVSSLIVEITISGNTAPKECEILGLTAMLKAYDPAPAIGQPWRGGYYVGRIPSTQRNHPYHLIIAPLSGGVSGVLTYKTVASVNSGSFPDPNNPNYLFDGAENTRRYSATTFPSMRWGDLLSLGGYDDWYIPSREEFAIFQAAYAALPTAQKTSTNYWTSTESSTGAAIRGASATVNSFTSSTKTLSYATRAMRRVPA